MPEYTLFGLLSDFSLRLFGWILIFDNKVTEDSGKEWGTLNDDNAVWRLNGTAVLIQFRHSIVIGRIVTPRLLVRNISLIIAAPILWVDVTDHSSLIPLTFRGPKISFTSTKYHKWFLFDSTKISDSTYLISPLADSCYIPLTFSSTNISPTST